ncbi:MAG: hypothetical protein ACI9P5_003608 [Saprospiraceae bacterium]|jgi:hypothetical protein
MIIPLIIILALTIQSCISSSGGGAIPLLMDEFVSSTNDRRFELNGDLEGLIVKYQKSHDCDHEFYKYNATAIISINAELITIYEYCQQQNFKPGDKVRIKNPQTVNAQWSIREINEPLPKSIENYGYWQCISCKYANAFGTIELIEKQ